LDADICIDLLRGYTPAMTWFAGAPKSDIAVPGFVALELVAGCRDGQSRKHLDVLLKPFPRVWASPAVLENTFQTYSMLMLSHGIGAFDLMTAAVALETNATIHTFNQKHFGAVPGLKIHAPYARI